MAKDLSTYRVPHELRVAAAAKARETGVPVTDVLLWALGEFAQGRLPADLVREMSRRPPEPADPPAAPVAPPQGQSAPMERSEAPGPRAAPEPAPERRRRAPARRTAKAAQPGPDAHPESTAEAESEGARITAEIEADPDLVARLRRSRQQAREMTGRTGAPLAAAHALAEQIGAPLKVASELATPDHAPAASVFREPGSEAVIGTAPRTPAALRKRCNHPGKRSVGGYCPDCDHLIEPGGYWREP